MADGPSHAPAVFIGDEVTAAGYRLAGLEVLSPADEDVAATFTDVCRRARMVVITAEAARHLPDGRLSEMEARATPLIAVVTDARGHATPPDIEEHVRATLGLEI